MILKNDVLEKMRKNSRVKIRLAYELDASYPTVRRWINDNKPNGQLTTAKALQIISEELRILKCDILKEE